MRLLNQLPDNRSDWNFGGVIIDREKPKLSEKKLLHHFFGHYPGIEPKPPP
jgi:hypothetical protein